MEFNSITNLNGDISSGDPLGTDLYSDRTESTTSFRNKMSLQAYRERQITDFDNQYPIDAGFPDENGITQTGFVHADNSGFKINTKSSGQIIVSTDLIGASQPAKTTVDELYDFKCFEPSDLQTALKLLKECNKFALEALRLYENDLLKSDSQIMEIQARMPELYACRDLSPSYRMIIAAVQRGLFNNKGQILEERQIKALKTILAELREAVYMKKEKALDLVMEFEDTGFVVDLLPGIEQIGDILLDE